VPIGKDIYKQMSKRASSRKDRIDKIVKQRMVSGESPVSPPSVDQYKKNIVVRIHSNSLHITELAGARKRHVSPNEGMPAVNSKSGEEVVKKAVTKIRSKVKKADPTAGAILPVEKSKNKKTTSRKKPSRRCSNCNQSGHTKRSCPTLS